MYRGGGLISFPLGSCSCKRRLRCVWWHTGHSHSSDGCLRRTIWVPSKRFFVPLAVAEVSCPVTETCEGTSYCCCTICFANNNNRPSLCDCSCPDLAMRWIVIAAGRNCSGLCSFETEFLIATAMVVDPVVCLVVVGLGVLVPSTKRSTKRRPAKLVPKCPRPTKSRSRQQRVRPN